MNNDDIAQKLALLPEGLAEENVRSWQHVVQFCELVLSRSINFQWQHLLELIQKLSASEQTKLYRGGLSLYTLMISTKEKHGLEKEDAYIYVLIKDENSTEIGYYAANSDEAEKTIATMMNLLQNFNHFWTGYGMKCEGGKMLEKQNQLHPSQESERGKVEA